MKEIVKGLISINPNKEDYCDVRNLNPDWEKILSDYMSSRYIKCNTFNVHNSYFIAIDDVDEDTISMLNKAGITIYQIDYIVDSISICFKNEASRDMVFSVLKNEVD